MKYPLLLICCLIFLVNCATPREAVVGGKTYKEVFRPKFDKGRKNALEHAIVSINKSGNRITIAPVTGDIVIEDPRVKNIDYESKQNIIIGQLSTYLSYLKNRHNLNNLIIVEREHIDKIMETIKFNLSGFVSEDDTEILFNMYGVSHILVEDFHYSIDVLQWDYEVNQPYLEVKYIRTIRLLDTKSSEVIETFWDTESYLIKPDQSSFRIKWERR